MEQSANLESFKNQLNELCPKSLKCQDQQCKNIHPRCFTGVCIESLLKNGKKCSKENCKLYHYTKNKLKQEYNVQPINGIYRFNICQDQICQNEECEFLHVNWVKDLCLKNLLDDCEEEDDHNDLQHKSWGELMEKSRLKKEGINGDELCLVHNCNCDKHLVVNDEICVFNFKGVCPKLICEKQHLTWEEYLINNKTESCINKNKSIHIPTEDKPSQLFLEQKKFTYLQKTITDRSKVDIIFIMDCTGSMFEWIQASSEQIYGLIYQFQQFIPYSFAIRVGFVGYRDFCENEKRIEFHDLTCDIGKVIYFISQLQADGGGDEAEDVYGGIEKASKLSISNNDDTILVTFLFADAPTHGKQYHDESLSDEKQDEINDGHLEKLMQDYHKLKVNNFFYCVTINDSTNQMYQIMAQHFPGLVITNKAEPGSFPELVEFNLKRSFKLSILQNKSSKQQADKLKFQVLYVMPKHIPLTQDYEQNKFEYWKNFEQLVQDKYLRKGSTEISLYPAKKEEGNVSQVYYLEDDISCKKMVVKINKDVIQEYTDNNKVLKDSTIQESNKAAYIRFYSLLKAKQLAMIYRQKSKMIGGAPPLFFVSPIIYLLDKPFMGLTQIYAETFIELPKNIEWSKYTNNTNYVERVDYYMTSFSHFTYEETGKQFVITDLQGKLNILSDPSIQTNDKQILEENRDATDLQVEGIAYFKNQHIYCSIICLQLNLPYIQEDNLGYEDSKYQIQTESGLINVVCEQCDQFREMSFDAYQQAYNVICELCQKEEQIKDEIQCRCCKKIFQVPHQQARRFGTIPTLCPKCKQNCNCKNKLNEFQTIDESFITSSWPSQIKIKQNEQSNECHYCAIDCRSKQVKSRQVAKQQIYLCRDAVIYLNELKCESCQKDYDYSQLLSSQDYQQGQYRCNKCKENQY